MLELIGVFVILLCMSYTFVSLAVFAAIKLGWLPGVKWKWPWQR